MTDKEPMKNPPAGFRADVLVMTPHQWDDLSAQSPMHLERTQDPSLIFRGIHVTTLEPNKQKCYIRKCLRKGKYVASLEPDGTCYLYKPKNAT